MRVFDEIVRSGYFWLPEQTYEQGLPGTLTIRDGGQAELEILGNFDRDITDYESHWAIPRVVGHIEKEGSVTLEFCRYRTKSLSFGGIGKSVLHVHYTIIGANFGEDEEAEFNVFRFAIEGLENWISDSGTVIQMEKERRTALVSYKAPSDRKYTLGNSMTLMISFDARLSRTDWGLGGKIVEVVHFKIESSKRQSLDAFAMVAKKLTNLLCLAMEETVSIKEAHVSWGKLIKKDPSGRPRSSAMRLYYRSLPTVERTSKTHYHPGLFSFKDIEDRFQNFLSGWFDAYEAIEPALDLYFSTRVGGHRFVEPHFLALAQALETLHRRTSAEKLMSKDKFSKLVKSLLSQCPEEHQDWLRGRISMGNEPPLRQRLASLAMPYAELLGGTDAVKALVKRVTDTRNYLTHYDPRLEKKAALGSELNELSMRLEALVELHLLQRIGFTPDEITNLAKSGQRLPQKLRYA